MRWVDGARQQITDCLTKKNGNADLLRAVLDLGQFAVVEAAEALELKKQARELRKQRSGTRARNGAAVDPVLVAQSAVVEYSLDSENNPDVEDLLDLEPEYATRLRLALGLG